MRGFAQSAVAGAVLVGFAVAAGAVGAAVAQNMGAAPRGASVAGDAWCAVVLEQDLGRFQERVTQSVAAGGEVKGSNYLADNDRIYYYALVCRAKPQVSGGG